MDLESRRHSRHSAAGLGTGGFLFLREAFVLLTFYPKNRGDSYPVFEKYFSKRKAVQTDCFCSEGPERAGSPERAALCVQVQLLQTENQMYLAETTLPNSKVGKTMGICIEGSELFRFGFDKIAEMCRTEQGPVTLTRNGESSGREMAGAKYFGK